MAAVFVRKNNTIYLKVDGNTQYVSFQAASTAAYTYRVQIGYLPYIYKIYGDPDGQRYQTDGLIGPGSGNVNNSRFPGTGYLYQVSGTGIRELEVSCVGTSAQNNINYDPTNTNALVCLGNTPLTAQGGILAFPGTGSSNIYLNQSGSFKGAVNIFTKRGGQWAQCQDVYIKENGQWKLTYTNSSDYVNMLELLDDNLDFAIQVFGYDTCTVETQESKYGTGFIGYLQYGNGYRLKASNNDDRFITSLKNSPWAGFSAFTTNGGVSTTYADISSFIINHYVTEFGRYPDAIGYDYWIDDFIQNYSYTNWEIFTSTINNAFFGAEYVQHLQNGGLVAHYDNCSNLRVNTVNITPPPPPPDNSGN